MEKIKIKSSNNIYFDGPFLIKPDIYEDSRGLFFESWNKKKFNDLCDKEVNFVQDNHSYSDFGVVRGLHYQLNPKAQDKLIRVVSGKIFDVIVDLRFSSKTFKSWAAVDLNCENKNILWVPKGFAHGFLSLNENTQVIYKTTDFWSARLERSINWLDKDLKILWPEISDKKKYNLSSKDSSAYSLKELEEKGELFE